MLTVTLSDDVESRVASEASKRGIDARALALTLIEQGLPDLPVAVGVANAATIKLLEQWQRESDEDRTDDPVELERRQREHDEFMRAIDRHAADK